MAVAAGVVWFVSNLSVGGPKDLGVRYTQADVVSAMAKTGITTQMDNQTRTELETMRASNQKASIRDYTFAFSDYEQKQFELTPAEATAFLNEIAPTFLWFDKVNILTDGTMAGSSTADIKRLKEDLYADVAGDIPIPLPNKINLYSKGTLSIKNNRLSGDPKEFDIGPILLPDRFMDRESIRTMETYFESIIEKAEVFANTVGYFLSSRSQTFNREKSPMKRIVNQCMYEIVN